MSWCPPVPRPGQLVCAAVNYIEADRPDRGPFNAFLKATSSLLGHQGTVQLPPAEARVFHFEPELALVIGKRASRISAEEAMDHIFGYTHFMDVSARGLPGGSSWAKAGTPAARWDRPWSRRTKSATPISSTSNCGLMIRFVTTSRPT